MAGSNEMGNAASRELDAEEVAQKLACTIIGHRLAFYQRDSQGLYSGSILDWCFDCRRKARSCQMKTLGTLFFFYAMLSYPKSLGRQVKHLASLWYVCWKVLQILLAVLTAFYQ